MFVVLFILAGVVFLATMWFIVQKLNQIHLLVNSRLSTALSEIRALKDKLGIPHDDADEG